MIEIKENTKELLFHLIVTLIISFVAIYIGIKDNWGYYIGEGSFSPNKYQSLLAAIIFLSTYLIYGMLMGALKKKSFLKFLVIYWGTCGLIQLIGGLVILPIRSFPFRRMFIVLVMLTGFLTFYPTKGLDYFYHNIPHGTFYSVLLTLTSIGSSWLSGALGYFFGSSLRKIKLSKKIDYPT